MEFISGKIDDVKYSVYSETGLHVFEEEVKEYIERYRKANPDKQLTTIAITEVPGTDEIDIEYSFRPVSFERIRRITGYLVGDMSKWNDAKTKECSDRVKHSVVNEAKEASQIAHNTQNKHNFCKNEENSR